MSKSENSEVATQELPKCPEIPTKLQGRLKVELDILPWEVIAQKLPVSFDFVQWRSKKRGGGKGGLVPRPSGGAQKGGEKKQKKVKKKKFDLQKFFARN